FRRWSAAPFIIDHNKGEEDQHVSLVFKIIVSFPASSAKASASMVRLTSL
ncbi:hypothetical protein GOP47_0028127, partial [Adiantum capillus-veneris]